MALHNELGRWGEDKAAELLRSKGLYIRHRDWHYGHCDIDIVAIDEFSSIIVFVEVKTRTSNVWGAPDEAVDLEKMNNVIKSARAYLRAYRLYHCEVRYDIISVVGTPELGCSITHRENAFDVTAAFYYNEQQRRRARFKKRPGTW